MSSITNNIVNTVTLTDDKDFSEQFIFTNEQTALYGIHAALLISLAANAVEQQFSLSNIFTCKYNGFFTGNVTIGTRDDKILISNSVAEFELSGSDVKSYILEPFGMFLPDLVPSISEHVFSCEGLTCWLLEDLTGYYSGQDSDIWILTSQGMLIATEELHNTPRDGSTYLSPTAVFDLTHQWTEQEVCNSEQIKTIILASN